jgi:hypothetical protein
VVVHDLTATEAANRVRHDFVANVSHELRTPLTSLRGYAETLLGGGLEDAEHREGFVRTIHDQAVRLEALIADLLSLAELERPGAALRLAPLDLREVAERQAAGLRPRATAAGLALHVEDGPLVPGRGSAGDREPADNAVRHRARRDLSRASGDRRRVVRWWTPAPASRPRTSPDSGRFYRVDKARSRGKGGTGLGLDREAHRAAPRRHGHGALRAGTGRHVRFGSRAARAAAPEAIAAAGERAGLGARGLTTRTPAAATRDVYGYASFRRALTRQPKPCVTHGSRSRSIGCH